MMTKKLEAIEGTASVQEAAKKMKDSLREFLSVS